MLRCRSLVNLCYAQTDRKRCNSYRCLTNEDCNLFSHSSPFPVVEDSDFNILNFDFSSDSEVDDCTDGSFHSAMLRIGEAGPKRQQRKHKGLLSSYLTPASKAALKFLEPKTPPPMDHETKQIIPHWAQYCEEKRFQKILNPIYPTCPEMTAKVSLWQGDITNLKVGAIVNSTSTQMSPCEKLDMLIESKAGLGLTKARIELSPIEIGRSKISAGFKLPAKSIIHTVPNGADMEVLQNCYWSCLEVARQNNVKTIAFPCLTPAHCTAMVALRTARLWLAENSNMERIVFVVVNDKELIAYETLMGHYFPI